MHNYNFDCYLVRCETCLLTLREEHSLRVLRRIFVPRWDEETEDWRKLHNEGLDELYSSPNVVQVIKSRRTKWAGHVACMGERRGIYMVLVRNQKGKNHLEEPGRLILRLILRKWDVGGMTGSSWLRIGPGGRHL